MMMMMMQERLCENNGNGGKTHYPFPANGNGDNIGCRLTRLLRRRYDPSKLHQWSAVLEREKPVTVNFRNAPQNCLRITQAKLCSSCVFESERNDLFCKAGDMPQILLCCLMKNHDEKTELDLEFGGPDDVQFSVKGPHKLCLLGYFFDGPPPPTVLFSQTIVPNGGPVVGRASGEQSSLQLTLMEEDSQITVSKDAGFGNTDMHTKAVDEATQLPAITVGAPKQPPLSIEWHPNSNGKLPGISVGAPKQPPLCIEWHPNSDNLVNPTHSNDKLLKIDSVNDVQVDGSMNQTVLEGSKAEKPIDFNDTQVVKFAEQGEDLKRYSGLLGSKRKRNYEDPLAEGLQGTDAKMEEKMDLLAQNKKAKHSAGNDFDIVHPERTSCIVDDNISSTGVPQRLDGQKLNPRNQRKRAKMTFACPYYQKVKRGRRAPCFNVNEGLAVANNNEGSTSGKLKPSLERQLLRYKPRQGLSAGRSICSNFWARLRRICGMKMT